jgi:hypothetical protein
MLPAFDHPYKIHIYFMSGKWKKLLCLLLGIRQEATLSSCRPSRRDMEKSVKDRQADLLQGTLDLLTRKGLAQFRTEQDQWERFSEAVGWILETG